MNVRKASAAIAFVLCVGGFLGAQTQPGGLSGLDTLFGRPQGPVTATTDDGRSIEQAVGDSVDANLEITTELPKEVKAGDPLRFSITVAGDPFRTVGRARVEIAVAIRPASGSPARIEPALATAPPRNAPADCKVTGPTASCTLAIDAGETVVLNGTIATPADGASGEIAVTARAFVGASERTMHAASATLTARPRLSNRGLRIGIEPDSDVAAANSPMAHIVHVQNSSATEDATAVVVEIRQRMGINNNGTLQKPAAAGFTTRPMTGSAPYSCTPPKTGTVLRCTIPSIRPGSTVKFPLEITITDELGPERPGALPRWGKLETLVRVSSAENDPDPSDNVARTSTKVLSALPQVVFVFQVREGENRRYESRDAVRTGEIFLLAARFGHVLVEPESLVVNVKAGNGQNQELTLRLPADGKSRTYASGALTVVEPTDKTVFENRTAIAAPPGSTVSVTYRGAEVARATVVPR